MYVTLLSSKQPNDPLTRTDITTPPNPSQESEPLQTVASISEERKAQSRSQLLSQTQQSQTTTYAAPDDETPAPGSPEELEEEASQEGAFNEETGEINWDCPCLGGMAHGPCGDQFRAAFSCFVFSKEEPKGVDCIEHFKAMQNCFREHPDIYGAELDDDEDGAAEGQEGQPAALATEATAQPGGAQPAISGQHARSNVSQPSPPPDLSVATTSERGEQSNPLGKVGQDHVSSADKDEEAGVPKASHDAR